MLRVSTAQPISSMVWQYLKAGGRYRMGQLDDGGVGIESRKFELPHSNMRR